MTASWPFDCGEEFLADEIEALAATTSLLVYPRDNPRSKGARQSGTEFINAIAGRRAAIRVGLLVPLSRQTRRLVIQATSLSQVARNLIKLPSVLGLINLLERWPTAHIHAHWGTTTATIAMVASEVTRRPWSFTLHRGDIGANNLLRLKVNSASFVRCVSEQGREWTTRVVGQDLAHKLTTIPMGVKLPPESALSDASRQRDFVIAMVPARLVPVKGHAVLIEALRLLRVQHGGRLRCILVGDGPERSRLQEIVRKYKLEEMVTFAGALRREDIIASYRRGSIDMVVLPSVVTSDGEHEGVPVSLMEAMAHRIPVVSTRSGAIPELVEGAGILVEPDDSVQLAHAISALCSTPSLVQRLAAAGRSVVEERFNADKTSSQLMAKIDASALAFRA